jgi:MtN3 and saliva related transmembrane protein
MLEAYAEILAILATLVGSISSLAYFPQAYKMYKRKSSSDISMVSYGIWTASTVIWFLYAISISNYPLITTSTLGLFGITSIIIMYFKYNKKKVSR